MMFDVCNPCTVGLVNDDWSHLDYWNTTDETVSVAMASVEAMGMVTPVDTVGHAFDCFVCGGTAYAGHVLERI